MQQIEKIKTMNQKKIREVGAEVSIKEALLSMELEEVISFPPSRYASVRSLASAYGFESGRTFRVKVDRENNRVLVSRKK